MSQRQSRQSWGPFVILHPDALEPIQEESRYTFPPRKDSRQPRPPPARRKQAPGKSAPTTAQSGACDHQDKHPEIFDDEIIDMYAAGWQAPRKAPEPVPRPESSNSDPTPLTSSWDDSSDDSDNDTLTPAKTKWRKAVTVAKGRLKQMKSKENLLDLPGLRTKASQGSFREGGSERAGIPLVRITSVSKLERHYGYTSPELQSIGIDSSCRVSEKSWSSGRWG